MSDLFFTHPLALVLVLEADGMQVEIHSGHIERVSCELYSYGFNASIQFSGYSDDKLDALMNSSKPTKVSLAFNSADPLNPGLKLLEIKGIVTRKFYSRIDAVSKENALPGKIEKQAVRHYQITAVDSARATWAHHYPINIYVDDSMKDVIEAHKNSEISVKYGFSPLEKKHPIIAFSLAYNDSLPENEQTSFYSFINWYLNQEGGFWSYDYKTNSYSILEKKESLSGDPFKIEEWWVAPPNGIFPQLPCHHLRTIKHSSDSFDNDDQESDTAFKSVRKDQITSTNYTAFPEHAYETVHSTTNPEDPQLEVEVIKFVGAFEIDKLVPGSFVSFVGGGQETWSDDPFYKGKTFRSRLLYLEATNLGISEKGVKYDQPYQLYVKSIFESKDEKHIDRPHFLPPSFPFTVQGKVFSDIGDQPQSTYKILENSNAPQGQYLVSVPLASYKNVVVPFTPDLMSGQFYFPFCKGEKVLLSMHFHTAKIQRIVDWQPLARLPAGVQGNQIVFGSNGENKYAIMEHEFEDGKNSVITIKQSTSDTQTQTIRIKDKDLIVIVDEKGKKTLKVHLNKDQGLTVSVEDKAGQMTQKVQLDGKQIVSTCKDSSNTSTYVQKPDSITVTCKAFNVTSDNITFTAMDTISVNGICKVDIETPITNIKADAVKMG